MDAQRQPQLHVISVGTSLLTNAQRAHAELDIPGPGADRRVAERTPELRPVLERYVREYPYEASAELKALRPFLEERLGDEPLLQAAHLIFTDSAAGALCADVLEGHLKTQGVREVSRQCMAAYYRRRDAAEPLSDEDERAEHFVMGLVELRNSLLDFIRRKRREGRYDILLNATGGFKPEVSVLTLVGGLTSTPVYYIHEFFRQVVYLPPLCLPQDVAQRLAGYLRAFPPERRLVGQESAKLHRALQEQGLWNDAVHLRLVRAHFEEPGQREPYRIDLTAYGLYLVEAAPPESGAPATP